MTDHSERPEKRSVSGQGGRVTLMFGEDAPAPSGEYLLRGGIAWPRVSPVDGMGGYAVLCGRHEATGAVWVLEEWPFVTVDWLKTGGKIEEAYTPIAPFFAACWHYYLVKTFHWRAVVDEQADYKREVMRCASIEPKPRLVLEDWRDEDQAVARLFVADRQDRLIYRPDGGVNSGLQRYVAEGSRLPVALDAVVCALKGMGRVRS